ncbi:MAG: DUF3467 domain-containing protein [Phycisphaerales bacterium]|nr:DUF3467 domain-containing protein [Phycisphaerales bacterium]
MIFGEEDSAQPMQNPQGQQRVRLDMSRMDTVYANFFAMAGSADEVVIFVGANSALPGTTEPSLSVSHRLILLPQNAKRLMLALQQTVKAHEDRFGPIELGPKG